MRSRYAAYALGKISYIIQTEHPQSPRQQQDKIAWRKELKVFCQHTNFIGLQILDEANFGENEATVTFHAILMQAGQDVSFTECSIFEKVNGRWLYLKPTQGKNWGR
jgi:SEC-C motif-containing protein